MHKKSTRNEIRSMRTDSMTVTGVSNKKRLALEVIPCWPLSCCHSIFWFTVLKVYSHLV